MRYTLVVLLLTGCQITNATGNLSTGDFTVKSMRFLTDTGLDVVGPRKSSIHLTSSPETQATNQLMTMLFQLALKNPNLQLHAPDDMTGSTDADD